MQLRRQEKDCLKFRITLQSSMRTLRKLKQDFRWKAFIRWMALYLIWVYHLHSLIMLKEDLATIQMQDLICV